jgi:hypothetical protein
MQSRGKVDLGNGLVEALAVNFGELEFLGGRLAGAIASGESSSAPGRATADFRVIGEEGKGGLVAQWDEDYTVVSHGGHGCDGSALLTSTLGPGGDEHTGVFAPQASGLPETTGLVPEGFPLGWKVTVTGGNAKEEGVVGLEDVRGDERDGGCVLARSVHLGEDFLG